jgi:hypothetical protein
MLDSDDMRGKDAGINKLRQPPYRKIESKVETRSNFSLGPINVLQQLIEPSNPPSSAL